MRKPTATALVIGCILAIAVSLWTLFATKSPKLHPGPFLALGEVLAQETAKVLGGRGNLVLLVSSARNEPGNAQRHEVDGFLHEIKKHPHLQIVGTKTRDYVETPTSDPQRDIKTYYEQTLQDYQDADALVTFIELPILAPDEPFDIPAVHPKILAAHLNATQGKAYMREKRIVAFVANRDTPPANLPAKPSTAREWFDKYYQLFTLANLEELD